MVNGIPNPFEASVDDMIEHPETLDRIKQYGTPDAHAIGQNDIKAIYKLIEKGVLRTVDDLESYVFRGSLWGTTQKALASSNTNMVNVMYGKVAWDQVNREATLFSLLKKVAWSTSGWRVIVDEATNTGTYTIEGGTIPAEEDPTFAKLYVTPASIVRRSKRSDILDALAELDDGVDMQVLAQWLSQRHHQIINKELLADANLASTAANTLVPIDRIIGSYAEIAYGAAANNAVITANKLDVYTLNRDAAATWTDANVSGQAYTLADRPLTLSMIDTSIRQIRALGGQYNNDMIMVTHPDTAVRIDQLCQSQQRFSELKGITYLKGGKGGMVNYGPERRDGAEGAFQVSTYRGIPIFEDPSVVQDVSLGRIYLINLNHLFISVLMPTKFYSWQGPETTASFDINLMYRTVGQTVCTNFRKQGKIRDLKE